MMRASKIYPLSRQAALTRAPMIAHRSGVHTIASAADPGAPTIAIPRDGGQAGDRDYRTGLSPVREAVISSHFMDGIAGDATLAPYDPETLIAQSWTIDDATIDRILLPILIDAARRFAADRAVAAVERAGRHRASYGLSDGAAIGVAEVVAELMFDRQLSRKAAATCSRRATRDRIAARLARGGTLCLAIPALPFKIGSPMKARGDLPDLGEVGFLLALFEIAIAAEIAARHVGAEPVAIRFVVISDGARFARLAQVPAASIARYRDALDDWIVRLGLSEHVEIMDYHALLRDCLPAPLLAEKHARADAARRHYTEILGPVFDPGEMRRTFAVARRLEPDPERENAEGRFASLLRSLVYTIEYRALAALALPDDIRAPLYRLMTSTIFVPRGDAHEPLRRAMLAEAWQAAIDYMAEIKSDRDLAEDPVLVCLPGAIRWTIHAKAGQFAIAASSVGGAIVQPWAGSAVFRRVEKGAIRLCAYPVLGLEGAQAVPVFGPARGEAPPQPLFYVDRSIACADIGAFLAELDRSLTRRRLK